MKQRMERVESLVREIVARQLSEALGEARALVTVTGVDVTADLKQAVVWVGLVDQSAIQQTEAKLAEVRGEVQAELAKSMKTKFVPRLEFRIDRGGEYAQGIERILKEL